MTKRRREISFRSFPVEVERRPDGSIRIRSVHELPPAPSRVTRWLEIRAEQAPRRLFLADRVAGREGWRTLDYAAALEAVRRIGRALLARGLSAERPVMVLSGNDIEHALLTLAALHVGIPVAPVSPAWSLLSQDFRQLRAAVRRTTPGLVFAAGGTAFARAIRAAVPEEVELVTVRDPLPDRRSTPFAALFEAEADARVEEAAASVGPDTVAKFLFTSGTTGDPKAVIQTHRMLCVNPVMVREVCAFLAERPPVLLDWLPWHHTAGGNNDLGLVLANGGSLWIDDGRPLPGEIERTLRNLREVRPTFRLDVPRGWALLLRHLRQDPSLAAAFFERLDALCWSGAAIPQELPDAWRQLARDTTGSEVAVFGAYGTTETGPFVSASDPWTSGAGEIGPPAPGVEAKLVPTGDRWEYRLRGPAVTPGYWRDPERTRAAFDEEGYWRSGDAVTFVDPARPARGLRLLGRLDEDFKLATGSWVRVGELRERFLAAFAPCVREVVFADPGCEELVALVFPAEEAVRALLPDGGAGLPLARLLADPRVRRWFAERLSAFAAAATGSTARVVRILPEAEPPVFDAGEITDKGTINGRAVRERRRARIALLYADPPPPEVIVAAPPEPP